MKQFIGQHVIVRTYSAGVHVGTLAEIEGTAVVLTNARRIWKWGGAFTLSEVSQNGIDPAKSRVSVTVPVIGLTQSIEIIPTSLTAQGKINACTE